MAMIPTSCTCSKELSVNINRLIFKVPAHQAVVRGYSGASLSAATSKVAASLTARAAVVVKMGIFTAGFDYLSNSSLFVQFGVLLLVGAMTLYFTSNSNVANTPPLVSYKIPFLGNAVEYGIHPINFLKECMEKVYLFLLIY
jgi:hypothetical protein